VISIDSIHLHTGALQSKPLRSRYKIKIGVRNG
jgi:hypothetical protein